MPAAAANLVLGDEPDLDAAIRRVWGENLTEQMQLLGVTNKQLVTLLKAQGIEVTTQAVGQWRSGQNAPRPHVMVAVASVLRVPPRMLFSLDMIRVAA